CRPVIPSRIGHELPSNYIPFHQIEAVDYSRNEASVNATKPHRVRHHDMTCSVRACSLQNTVAVGEPKIQKRPKNSGDYRKSKPAHELPRGPSLSVVRHLLALQTRTSAERDANNNQ